MYSFTFKLTEQAIKESHYYLALYDNKIRKQSLTLSFSLAALLSGIFVIILGFNINSLLWSLACIVISILVFPKIYWKVIFERIDRKIENTSFIYEEMKVVFDKAIKVIKGNKIVSIPYENVIKIDYTKNTCLIFYHENEKTNTLVIPNDILGDKITNIYELVSEEKG